MNVSGRIPQPFSNIYRGGLIKSETRFPYNPGHYAVILFMVGLMLVSSVKSQTVIHNNLGIKDGMVYSQVTSIHKDIYGYMWFGTSSGLSRWDGHHFNNYIFPKSLSDNNCKWITEFADSLMIIATRKNVVKYNYRTFRRLNGFPYDPNIRISGLLVSGNALFIATQTSGLWILKDETWRNLTQKDGLAANEITAITKSDPGAVYLSDGEANIYLYRDGILKTVDIAGIPKDLGINCLYKDDNDVLWVGTKKKGLYFATSAGYLKQRPILSGRKINSISEGENGQFFVATDKGVSIIRNYKPVFRLTQKQGLSAKFIWQVYPDRNNVYYIATDGGGVDIYRPGLFATIDQSCNLPNNEVWAICEDRDRHFYIGTTNGVAVYSLDGDTCRFIKSILPDHIILALHYASDGVLYAATNEHGVYAIKQNKIIHIDTALGLSGTSVWTIAEDNAGLIYFGTYGGGINIWNGARITDTLTTADGLPSDDIISSYLGSDGSIYFGTDGGGVVKYNRGTIDTVLLKTNTIWSTFEDQENNLYFATDDKGLIYYRNGQWDTLSIQEGLSHNSILGILQDKRGKLYLSSDNGLNSVEFIGDSIRIIRIGDKEGLSANECNQGAYFKDSRSLLWFGTVNGVTRFNPEYFLPDSLPPKTHLTSIRLYDKELLTGGKPARGTFSYNENYFKFEFIGINFAEPYGTRYKYRLKGLEDNWSVTQHNYVQYTNLKNNNYTFEVMAGNRWGYWSRPVTYSFTIAAPFWQTWWFALLILLIIAVPSFIIIRQRTLRTAAMQNLRAKIAADLHDEIGAGLSEISILSAVIPAKAPEDVVKQLRPDLEKIGVTARSIIDKMSDIVWMVNPHKDSMASLINRLTDSFSDIFEAKGIQFKTRNIEALNRKKIKMEYRQHLFLIFKEAIHNAVKYSGAHSITLSVQIHGTKLKITLQDDGRGIKDQKSVSGNGLKNMKKRAADINGALFVTSEPGKGTTVEFIGSLK
ncbi:MAG TPA: hypothetical protein ENK44_13290 [Caldithrix abyssi]|uniref:Histidine kinase domain-containing protein n=1 Tax=Caldithrix abyssi TaxID=187145 RepID=A0A7V4U284_CALAY|nr:hypothetical protein [Caldithrix abyssi]